MCKNVKNGNRDISKMKKREKAKKGATRPYVVSMFSLFLVFHFFSHTRYQILLYGPGGDVSKWPSKVIHRTSILFSMSTWLRMLPN